MTAIIAVEDLTKTYTSGSKSLHVLENINFSIAPGETVSIVGPSGSGKTTLLGLCAGLDKPSSGQIRFKSDSINNLSEDQRAALRNEHIGFIFQNFQLIPTLTALENVMVPLELQGHPEARSRSIELLERVGLGDRMSHYPTQLSGGEQQRVSIARAFSNHPEILFADEPTGNLDDETGQHIEQLLFQLNAEQGTTLIIVTHDLDLARKTQRIIKLKGGHIISDTSSNPQ